MWIAVGGVACTIPLFSGSYVAALVSGRGLTANPRQIEVVGERPLTISYRVYNMRPRTAQLKPEPSCGCLTPEWSSATIPPYGWKDLEFKVDPTGMDPGLPKGLTLRTDDPRQRFLFLYALKNL